MWVRSYHGQPPHQQDGIRQLRDDPVQCRGMSKKEIIKTTLINTGSKEREERWLEILTRSERNSPGSSDCWHGNLALFPLPKTGLTGSCTLIDRQYKLDKLRVNLPIMLGTIQLVKSVATPEVRRGEEESSQAGTGSLYRDTSSIKLTLFICLKIVT